MPTFKQLLVLGMWIDVDDSIWCFDQELPEIVTQVCPSGAHIAFKVWHLFRPFKWRDPSLSRRPDDFGISWCELAMYYAIHFGLFLPIWIYNGENKHARPVAFDSEEAPIQKPDAKSIWHQANNLCAVVRYLENTLKCQMFPWYKKTGASSLVRLGYNSRLIGGISARPFLPDAKVLMENIVHYYHTTHLYSSLANQPYPLNGRLEMPLVSSHGVRSTLLFPFMFQVRQNLYQKVKRIPSLEETF